MPPATAGSDRVALTVSGTRTTLREMRRAPVSFMRRCANGIERIIARLQGRISTPSIRMGVPPISCDLEDVLGRGRR